MVKSLAKKTVLHTFTKSLHKMNEGITDKKNHLSKTQNIVYGYIYGWISKGNPCFASIDVIASACECSRTTAHKAVKVLEELKWIAIKSGYRKGNRNPPNRYTILRYPPDATPKKQTIAGLKEKNRKERKEESTLYDKKMRAIYAITKQIEALGIKSEYAEQIKTRIQILAFSTSAEATSI